MKYYTTYSEVLSGMEEGSSDFLKWLETQVTGNRMAYGLDTPIYLVDLLDKIMPEIPTLLDYCVQDTRDIKKVIAMELVKAHLGPWMEQAPQDDKLFNLMVFSEMFMDSQHQSSIRYDYCGDPIPGSGDITPDQINTRIAEIEALYGTWTYSRPAPSMYTWAVVGATPRTNGPTWGGYPQIGNGTDWQYLTGPDDVQQDPYAYEMHNNLLSLSLGNIDTMLENDPDIFFKMSDEVRATMWASGTPYYYQRVQLFPRHSSGSYGDHLAESARYIARAAVNAARMALGASGCLSTVILLIQRSITAYQTYRYTEITRNFLRVNELGGMIMPVNAAPQGEPQYALENEILSAVWAKRYDLLHDPDYIKTFDTNLTGTLSTTEWLALEKDVKVQMKATALSLADSMREQMADSYRNMNALDSIVSIMRPLLL